jgi:protein TonB
MVILPTALAPYAEPPRQTWHRLQVNMVWSALLHVTALAALLYWGLPAAHLQPVANKEPLTLVEVSRSAPTAVAQTTQITQAAPRLAQTRAQSPVALQSEPAKPLTTTNLPLPASTAIATTSSATSPVNVPVTLQADSAEKNNALTGATLPNTSATQVAPVALTPSRPNVAAINAAPAAQASITELPISNAAYLNNPPPQYPAQSRRLGEQGTVKWRVLIGTDGKASQPELVQSSGFTRLDEAAKQAVLAWRYVPGKRGGVAEPMTAIIPLSFSSGQP